MAFNLVQQAENGNGSSVSSVTVTLGSVPAAGDLLIACVAFTGTCGQVSTITGGGGTWTRAWYTESTAGIDTEIWYAPNVSGSGGTAISVTLAGSSPVQCNVSEWSGGAPTSVLDVYAGQPGVSPGTALTTGTTGTAAASTDLFIAAFTGTSAVTPATPFTALTGGGAGGNFLGLGYYLPGSTAAQTGTATQAFSGNWAGAIAAFKVPTGATPTITGFTPGTGAAGTSVTITGTNFDGVPANNTVRFNGVAAVVSSGTTTQLVVSVPVGASTGPITVTNSGGTATSGSSFIIPANPNGGQGQGVSMPGTSNQTLGYAGTIFAEGVITLTMPGGVQDGVTIGIIQDVSFEVKLTKKKLMGPGSKMPYAVAVSERVVSIKAKHSAFSAQAIIAAVGGTAAYNSGTNVTTVTSLGNDQPPILKLTLKSPADGSDAVLTFPKVVADMASWTLKTHDFGEESWECEAYPDPNSTPLAGVVYTISFPGNETAS